MFSFRNAASTSFLAIIFFLSSLSFSVFASEEEVEVNEETPTSRYVPIVDPFVTNYGGARRLRYVKVEVTLRVSGNDGEAQVAHHLPLIRDDILTLLSLQTNESIKSAEGKESIRVEALKNINALVSEEDGESFIEDLLFTSFVAQG